MVLLLRWYKRLVDKYPYRTQMVTAGLLSTSGDIIAQTLTKKQEASYNVRRMATMGTLGFLWVAPFSITWFQYLKTLELSVFKSVLLDQMFGLPACYLGFLYFHPFLMYGNSVIAKEKLEEKYFSVIFKGWMLWIPAQTINFLVVPFYFRILYIQSVSLVWQSFLSFLTNFEENNSK